MKTVYFDEESGIGERVESVIKLSQIPQGVTQCVNHHWKKLNDTEISCTKCPTVLIVEKDDERLLQS